MRIQVVQDKLNLNLISTIVNHTAEDGETLNK